VSDAPAHRRLATIALLLWLAVVAGFLGTRNWHTALSTQLLDVLPDSAEAEDPALGVAREWATDQQSRTTLVLLERVDGAPVQPEDRQAFVQQLDDSGLFTTVYTLSDGTFVRSFAAEMFRQRLPLLWPQWQQTHDADPKQAAQETIRELDAYLASPDSFALERLIPQDPLLLMAHWQDEMQQALRPQAGGSVLIWLENGGDNPTGVAAEDARQAALKAARSTLPGTAADWRVLDTGFPKFSAENERRIRAEINWLNTLSLVGVVLLTWLFTRRLQLVLEVSLLLGLTLASALAFTLLAVGQVHALTLVTGSILAGLAIDYTLHVRLYHHGPEQERELLWRPLLLGAGSTLAAFALLLWSELPMLRQLGWFMLGGLAASIGLVSLYRQIARPIRENHLPEIRTHDGLWRWAVLGLLVLLVAPGLSRLHWSHDLRNLQYPLPGLEAEQQTILQTAGDAAGRQQLLIGDSPAALIRAVHQMAAQGAQPESTDRWFLTLPTLPDARAAQAQAAGDWGTAFADELRRAMRDSGYEVDAFDGFFTAWETYRHTPIDGSAYAQSLLDLEAELAGPLRLLTHFRDSNDRAWITLSGQWPQPQDDSVQLIPVSQIQHLNELLARYTTHLKHYGYLMLIVVAVAMLLLQGPKRTLRLLLRLGLAIGLGLGIVSWLWPALNLFHLLAIFLGVGILLDYGLFSLAARQRSQPLPPSILMSAATTGYSFAVLGFSQIPAAHALGRMVALLVACGLLVVLLLHPQTAKLGSSDEGS